MKSFKEYLAESAKEHYFAIKFGMQPTDNHVATLENHLKKYGLVKFEKPVHVEHDKIDFFDVQPHDTWQAVAVLSEPVASYTLMQDIKKTLDIPEDYIVVRAPNEPVQVYADDCAFDCDADADAKVKGLQPAARLSTDRFYDDAEQPLLTGLFGNEYNKKLLDYLAKVADDRQTDHYEAPAPLFSWIDMDKVTKAEAVEQEDFNEHIDTPKPVTKGKGKDTPPVEPKHLGTEGNLDDSTIQRVKLYKNEKGKREAVSAPRARLRAGK